MGNKLGGRRRQVVDDKYTKPQGLYQHKDVDHKKLRKLILDSKLAPCYPGDDDTAFDLEECPICFLTSNYAVEYRGVKTKEEKGIEQIEEQRVIEAKIRMRQQEIHDEEEKMQKRHDVSSSSSIVRSSEVEYNNSLAELSSPVESEETISPQHTSPNPSSRQPLHPRQNREDEFDLDLEDVMVMEAIWLSIQEDGRHYNPSYSGSAPLEQYISEDHRVSASMAPLPDTSVSSSSPSGGLACAIAALAERQQVGGDFSGSYNGNISSYNMVPGPSRFSSQEDQMNINYPSSGDIEGLPDIRDESKWVAGSQSDVAEVGTSYDGSDHAEDVDRVSTFPQEDENDSAGFQNVPGGSIVPESFEEQMMLAMAVSLAEARARTNAPGTAWQ